MNHISDNIRAFLEDFNRANNAFDPDLLAPHVSDPLDWLCPDPHEDPRNNGTRSA